MVLAPIVPSREQELRGLLASMNEGPGRVNPDNALIPFARFENLHYARLLILDDQTTEDVRVYGLRPKTYPLYLAFLGDIDGAEGSFLAELVKVAASGLRQLFSCCAGFEAGTDLLAWMREHRKPSIANYVNWKGRTVRRVREEAMLQQAIESYIQANSSLQNLGPREIYTKVREFILAQKESGRLTLTPESPTPVGWWITNLLHLVGIPLLVLIL